MTRTPILHIATVAVFSPLLAAQPSQQSTPTGPSPAKLTPIEFVYRSVADGARIPIENPAALIPFYEQLYRHSNGMLPGPVRILHYGDSHTAADSWTGEMRARFQGRFGDGGSGYSLAGKPWRAYRRFGVGSGSSKDWYTDGLVGRYGDGVYGLGGVSMTTDEPGQSIYVDTAADRFELFYYQQPGGGALQLSDNGVPIDLLSTDGQAGPAYYVFQAEPGEHRFELETLDRAPVRIFGWVAENQSGVTYETLGINGAEAITTQRWNEITLRANIQRRDPALIVLAYGTNDAGRKSYTVDSYREMFKEVITRFRAAAPTAAILVIGPPDRSQRTRRGWSTMDQIGVVAEGQRQAALETGAAFLDLRAKMGGPGSMLEWARAEIAQRDHVHFYDSGYRMLGDAVYRDLINQYETFLDVRSSIMADAAPVPGPPPAQQPARQALAAPHP